MPIWLNRSSRRAWSAGMKSSGSKSSTWAATCDRNGDGSNRSMRLDRRARGPHPGTERLDADAAGGHDPDAGDPDASSVGHDDGFVVDGAAGLDGLGERPERGQRPTGDRAGEPAVDERREARDRRLERVLDRHAAPAAVRRRPDAPGDVHALRGAGDVHEPQSMVSPDRSTSALARSPGGQPEDRHERSPGDEVDDERSVRASLHDRSADVVGEQRPASARHRGQARRPGDGGAAMSMAISLCTSGDRRRAASRWRGGPARRAAAGAPRRASPSDRCRSSRRARRAARRR